MPIYEYRCADCKRRASIFFRSFAAIGDPTCPNCGGKNLARLVSRVATVKSEETRLEAMSDPSAFGDVDENDPKSVARFMRKMGNQMGGEDLGPEFGEMVDRLESGESPEEIEKTMPGMGGADSAAPGMDF
ncbi:MAG: zinc ribbon domain-containing protein [Anaerolineales bacterium]|nr:zinc ribbon domain-containing protein [Anaerolineales bacterium]